MADKNLFGQGLVSSLNITKRICFGEPTQEGCDNILISDFLTDVRGYIRLSSIDNTYSDYITIDNSSIVGINIKLLSGSPTFRMGISPSGQEIVEDLTIDSSIRISISYPVYEASSLYVSIVGAGIVDVTIVFEKNIFQ